MVFKRTLKSRLIKYTCLYLIILLAMLGLWLISVNPTAMNWHLSGRIFEDISPSIGGDLRKKGDFFYIFD